MVGHNFGSPGIWYILHFYCKLDCTRLWAAPNLQSQPVHGTLEVELRLVQVCRSIPAFGCPCVNLSVFSRGDSHPLITLCVIDDRRALEWWKKSECDNLNRCRSPKLWSRVFRARCHFKFEREGRMKFKVCFWKKHQLHHLLGETLLQDVYWLGWIPRPPKDGARCISLDFLSFGLIIINSQSFQSLAKLKAT
jgi:hypothetical protein